MMHGPIRIRFTSKIVSVEYDMNMGIWTGLGWPRIETGGRHL